MEENQPTLEELINKIELLKQALLYYAEEKNYKGENPKILLDSGFQAKFALESLAKIDEYHDQMLKEVSEIMMGYGVEGNNDDETMNKLQEISNLINKYNK